MILFLAYFGKKKIRIGEGSESSQSLDFIDERAPSAGTDMLLSERRFESFRQSKLYCEDGFVFWK